LIGKLNYGITSLNFGKRVKNSLKEVVIMPRVRFIEWEDASPEVRKIYEDIQKTRKEGIPKSFKACANNFNVLKARWDFHKRIFYSDTCLPPKLKEAIQLVVVKAIGCEA
jgi:hypothetical protein